MENQPPPQLHQHTPPPPNPNPNPEQQQQQQQQYYYPNPNPPPPQNPRPNPNAEQQQQYHYPNPSPAAAGPYAPHGGYAVDPTASVGAACNYYQGSGWDPPQSFEVDPNSHGQVPAIASNGLYPAAVPSQWRAKSNCKRGAKKGTTTTTKVAQPVHCGVCKIECSTQEVLNIHKQGKKHKKNLQKLQESITPKHLRSPVATNGAEKKGTKILEGAGPHEAMRRAYCEVCKIYCDTQADLSIHERGRKHEKNSQKLRQPITPKPQEDQVTTNREDDEAKILEAAEPNKGMQPAYCAICNVYCNSNVVLNIHNVGRKHKNNLLKSQNSITPKPDQAQSTANSAENKEASVLEQEKALGLEQRKRKKVTEEDLETKKMKILGGGAEPSEVKVCSICNVVVNSQIVYISHVAGLKHAAMVKKHKEAAVVEGETNVDSGSWVDPILTSNG